MAGREKDHVFARAVFAHRMADPRVVRERLAATALDPALRRATELRLERALAEAG